ncbi:cytochrome c-type biogenesis protein CcdA [Thermoclostridium stercorarium subsp. stercorarium DSM 8532]|uniref:Cytochrome c-type biogenesis protein CcdA n=3 Tax=Thermoclostridium stercorarium TaxID=1510 RepID=L7VUK8_THES1|nr:cytochrome c biogenesis CcdA family protein [Thermoclostridium stercorarium]AGC69268.1 cytochrome c-type biogenesis protein CcdA [Thermoclostridium stercorarium subsp. stercorarium DSM 8532]AGI40235.1 cytochrome-c biogenesis protein [Thermoclostridium stercorarium subsp. stercorarium DSM 8532]ANW99539.1 cytochrome C biogenesis protein ResB [Thermoclostridium stercorarium subsp. thermolacticum DSM 2910]ANX02166.1 cytochrome C biogenesis protein ResB [Thermoclostridium stercorarium subsp. lept
MDYFLTFLEGIITFISPCLLPMLPVYISYFAGQDSKGDRKKALINALGFVVGFTIIFIIMGALAGSVGGFLRKNQVFVNLITGLIVIVFGLNFLGVVNIPLLNRTRILGLSNNDPKFLHTVLFGLVFSISWTPCVGVFLGSALMLAAYGGESLKGILMLLCFSLGLGIPFVISAVLIDRLKTSFDFIKRNYRVINTLSGSLLVLIGILMATGLMGKFVSLLSS